VPNKFFYLILLGLFYLCGCHKEHEVEVENYRTVIMPEISKELQLPNQMWDMVTGAGFEKSVKTSANFMYAPITVRLEEKSKGVLTDPAIKVQFSRAGGELDFSKYVVNEKGSFKLFFESEAFAPDSEEQQIFYVSRTKKRRLDDGIYGSGCKNFFDVRSYIQKMNPKEGILLNVTRDRHVSAVGGTILFSYKKNRQLFVSQVTFTDSRRSDLFCDQEKTEKTEKK
jgi:hypothetical protein